MSHEMTYPKVIVMVVPWAVAGVIAVVASPFAGGVTACFAFLQNFVFWESMR